MNTTCAGKKAGSFRRKQKAGRERHGQPFHYTKQEDKGPISAIPWREFFAGKELPNPEME
jgi:hypothetical protein